MPLSAAALRRAIDAQRRSDRDEPRRLRLGPRGARPILTALRRSPGATTPSASEDQSLAALVARRAGFLAAYQNRATPSAIARLSRRWRSAERERAPGSEALAEAVARNLFKLMAYKDEYEVARLYSDGAFADALRERVRRRSQD